MSAAYDAIDPAISCRECAAVCCRLTVILLAGDRVPSWFLGHDDNGIECMAKGDDGWCAALDRTSGRCTIYAQRPQVCRDFDMGGGSCRDERHAWYGRIPIAVIEDGA